MSMRLAMWSGPRHISTVLMRSWGSRSDCFVSDEPLYAHYLGEIDEGKRREHPAYAEVMRFSSFEDLADHPDAAVRRWVASHVPERPSGLHEASMYEDHIDTLIESSPDDDEVVEFARRAQRPRSSE